MTRAGQPLLGEPSSVAPCSMSFFFFGRHGHRSIPGSPVGAPPSAPRVTGSITQVRVVQGCRLGGCGPYVAGRADRDGDWRELSRNGGGKSLVAAGAGSEMTQL